MAGFLDTHSPSGKCVWTENLGGLFPFPGVLNVVAGAAKLIPESSVQKVAKLDLKGLLPLFKPQENVEILIRETLCLFSLN